MPRKVFVAGEILTAADVNTNLADQAVMTFAGTAARGSAIASPSEGMVTYLEDTDQLEVYGGTAVGWSSASNFLFGTATPSEGQVATFSTAVSGYVPADAPSGKILQVVQGTDSSSTDTTSSSFVDTGLSVSITPSSATSKVFVLSMQNFRVVESASSDIAGMLRLMRDATSLTENQIRIRAAEHSATLVNTQSVTLSFLDSPASTSALTYKTQMAVDVGSPALRVDEFGPSTIIAMEVAA